MPRPGKQQHKEARAKQRLSVNGAGPRPGNPTTPPRTSNNPAGRPSRGLAEAKVLVTGPPELLAAMTERATERSISVREAWRRAARTWLAHGTLTPEDLAELEG